MRELNEFVLFKIQEFVDSLAHSSEDSKTAYFDFLCKLYQNNQWQLPGSELEE